MNKIIAKSVKVAVMAGALAAALTGCCLFGSKDCCDKKCCGRKTSGVNTSMTVGVGTDGVTAGAGGGVN